MAITPSSIVTQESDKSLKYLSFTIFQRGFNAAIAMFALKFCPPLTYQKIGDAFGISKSRVSQLAKREVKKIAEANS